ncbi:hypothetical protein GUJ93_ZPchr0012g21041 [Zizania palustris]|uniref:Uncharacterized protein n=1 Tax=Zizania palustris TaxID=103762 RepID=A0A8J5WP14_ZIZPA|nr:hypothetical protein GUJ93_ZPchr0012g21041 [Zizania palustris]
MSGHISKCSFKAAPKVGQEEAFSPSRNPKLSPKKFASQCASATPPATMEPIFPSSAIPGIIGDHPQEEFSFMAASGEISEKVMELSNHALVSLEIGLPDDHEKVDIHRFAEDFQRFFNTSSGQIKGVQKLFRLYGGASFVEQSNQAETVDPMSEEWFCNQASLLGGNTQQTQQLSALVLQIEETLVGEEEHLQNVIADAEEFNSKLQEFISQVSAALP